MTGCEPVRALLRAFVAGQLPEDELAPVKEHLESCGSCAGLDRTYRATVAMGAWPEEEIPLPEGLGEIVREAVRRHNTPAESADEAEVQPPADGRPAPQRG